MVVRGQGLMGVNIDDGGEYDRPVKGVIVQGLVNSDIGPSGNHDTLKMSGVDQSLIRKCKFQGWGGQAIDLVGCHQILIQNCHLQGKADFTRSAGIQAKGGCNEITVEHCVLENAGMRPLNLGGSTGMAFFRPSMAKYEARNILVRHNRIIGGQCAASLVGLDGGVFEHNQILSPTRWIFRILQETKEQGFPPWRNVTIQNNQIHFLRSQIVTEVNVGSGTAPETFRFRKNHWYATDQPELSKPKLPVEESLGTYGKLSVE